MGKGSAKNSSANMQQQQQRRKKTTNRGKKFFIPRTKQQFQTCLQRLTLQFFNCAFSIADKAMYLLGPILIALASGIIGGLTYVFFRVILPMLAGTNWVYTVEDWDAYWKGRGYESVAAAGDTEGDIGKELDDSTQISILSSTFLALSTPTGIFHTLLVTFFLANIIYNYYKCVTTSNAGPSYDVVVRELAEVTGFDYPETEEDLVRCKKDFERKLYEKVKRKRDEYVATSRRAANNAGNGAASSSNTNATITRSGGDEESQSSQTSPLMATSTQNSTINTNLTTPLAPQNNNAPPQSQQQAPPQPMPRIHNWQLLTPTEWSYCRHSSQPKPPRSHYDHVTKALVLNMDHYCPWMFNCVGYFNYRYFFNFLWFVAIALAYGAAICARPFWYLNSEEYRQQVRASGGFSRPLRDIIVKHNQGDPFIPTPDERTPVALGFMMCICLAAAVLCLGGFHLYLVLSAQSTIEFHGNWSKRSRAKKTGRVWKNPYSAGSWRKNWEMVYGTRYWSYHGKKEGDEDCDEEDEERYRHRGCCGIFMAMMPSSREPEFLPLPIDGRMVRRKNRSVYKNVERNTQQDEEWDIEKGSSSEIPISYSGSKKPDIDETEFLMEPKDTDGPLVGRANRTRNKASDDRVM